MGVFVFHPLRTRRARFMEINIIYIENKTYPLIYFKSVPSHAERRLAKDAKRCENETASIPIGRVKQSARGTSVTRLVEQSRIRERCLDKTASVNALHTIDVRSQKIVAIANSATIRHDRTPTKQFDHHMFTTCSSGHVDMRKAPQISGRCVRTASSNSTRR